LPERHPACRRREAQPGSCMERENLPGDAKGKGTSGDNHEAESTDALARGGLLQKRIAPACKRSRPVMQLKSVVLPEPLGPMRPWILPAANDKEQRFAAVTPPKRLVTSSISRIAAAEGMSDGTWQPVALAENPENSLRHHQNHGDNSMEMPPREQKHAQNCRTRGN
jgi:hypothetical protein